MKTYYVYTLASASRTLYTGVTNNLERRVLEHRRKLIPGFTSRYNVSRLVHYEVFGDIRAAIDREKQIKGWLRRKKVALIETTNRDWQDLSQDWFGAERPTGEQSIGGSTGPALPNESSGAQSGRQRQPGPGPARLRAASRERTAVARQRVDR